MKFIYFSLMLGALFISCKEKHNSIDQKEASLFHIFDNTKITIQDSIKKDSMEKSLAHTSPAIPRDTSKYYIYFTLDDGPQLPGTENCKKILTDSQTKATFFMIGLHDTGNKNSRIVDSLNNNPLFIVANHSDTHGFRNKFKFFYQNPDSALKDFMKAENKLNIKHKIARLPGRNTWAINHKFKGESSGFSVAKKLDSIGYSVYGWDMEWRFTHGKNTPVQSATQMVKDVKHQLTKGKTYHPKSIVILVHDRMFDKPQYADSLKKFITTLKNDNEFIFDTLDNYPTYSSLTP